MVQNLYGVLHRGIWALLFAVLALGGCGYVSQDEAEQARLDITAAELFDQAQDLYMQGRFAKAAEAFSEVEVVYSYTNRGKRSIILAAQSYYDAGDYVQAIANAKRYMLLYPSADDIDYALYLIGISYQAQLGNVSRDSSAAEQAVVAFQDLIRRVPNSQYVEDAKIYIDQLYSRLARKEIDIAHYYLDRNDYVAALNRFKTVVTRYPTTDYAAESLMRMAEIYISMGLFLEAQNSVLVLDRGYPSSHWRNNAYHLLSEHGLETMSRDETGYVLPSGGDAAEYARATDHP